MPYELLIGVGALHDAKASWEALERSTQASYFQSYALACAWFDTYGQRAGAEPRIVVLHENGAPVALFPACTILLRGLRVLTWLGVPDALDTGDVLFDASRAQVSAQDFVAQALELLKPHVFSAPLVLSHVREDAIAFEALSARLSRYEHGVCLYVPLQGDYDAFMSGLSQRQRSNLRRHMRRLQGAGEHGFEAIPLEGKADTGLIRDVMDLKVRQRQAGGLPIDQMGEQYLAFCARQLGCGASGIGFSLTLKGSMIAGSFGVIHANRFHGVLIAYDPECAEYSPGNLLMWLVFQKCHELGLTAYDLGWGSDKYKYCWKPVELPLATFVDRGPVGMTMRAIGHARDRYAQAKDPYEAARRMPRGDTATCD